ncbi:MAG TPA: glycoside hydrolase family 3 N-terminal domain-containing protein, partial [Candidatus Hydrogenedentes bacterium]|nr:glycoside hydrolase family 3 N-terminal domain-containing protein [Candidatus Hydrogenedentota bacterium]
MQHWRLAIIVGAVAGLMGPAYAQIREFGLSGAGEQTANEEVSGSAAEWAIESTVAGMSLRTRVSQLLMVTLQGRLAPDATERQLLENYTPGAVLISSLTRPRDAVDYIAALQRTPVRGQHGVPMLIGADLADLPVVFGMQKEDYFAPLPTMMAVAAADDPVATRGLAALYAEHLALMGFSFQMGPCLALGPDLPYAKGGLQCLGANPAFVGETAEIFLQSFAERDLAVMFTGFPGGQWNQTGTAPPMLFTPASLLPTRDLLPFQRAVLGGARLILVGNIVVPHLDKQNAAASISPAVMTGLLREKLLYPGIIVAGPIDGLGVGKGATQGDAALAALKAGADMLFWRQPGIHVMKAAEAVVQAVENGHYPESAINASVTRVL